MKRVLALWRLLKIDIHIFKPISSSCKDVPIECKFHDQNWRKWSEDQFNAFKSLEAIFKSLNPDESFQPFFVISR